MPLLKKLFWLYFLLLIFEGALRKWFLPGLSAPLLLVRDPVGLLILLEAYRTNRWPGKWSTLAGILAAALVILCALQLIIGENSWMAALYGLRSYLLPFPVAFVMGENLTAEDLRKFGLVTLWLLLPLTALEIAQYLAPPTSFLNAGAYEGAQQINYAGGHVRASATFSYVAGPIGYAPVAAAFLFYGMINEKFAQKWLLWASAGALFLSIPVIGSRTVAFNLAGVVACAAIAALMGASSLFRILKFAAPVLAVSFLVSLLPVFSAASVSLQDRVSTANAVEGGSVRRVVAHRTVAPIANQLALADYASRPIGVGMGQGAAAITKLRTGTVSFSLGEGELGRVIAEMGAFPGVFYMLFRIFLALYLLKEALVAARNQRPLALLFATLAPGIFFNVLEQPTEQGFMVINIAFLLAALNMARQHTAPAIPKPARRMPLRYTMR